jgi:hypothetical protein
LLRKSTKFVLEFCGLGLLGMLALVDTATLSCFNRDFLRISAQAPCPLTTAILSRKLLAICVKLFFEQRRIYSLDRNFPENSGYDSLVASNFFRWESLRGWDFGPQLVVLSGPFGGNPFVDVILGHNLLLFQAFSVGIPSWMGF